MNKVRLWRWYTSANPSYVIFGKILILSSDEIYTIIDKLVNDGYYLQMYKDGDLLEIAVNNKWVK